MLMTPIFPDAQPWDSVLLAIVAVAVVVVKRKTMLSRGAGMTNVLMLGDEHVLGEAPLPTVNAGSTLSAGHVTSTPDR